MTDGTAASRRTTGSNTRLRARGANSTMKIALSSDSASPNTTAKPVVRIVSHSSGQARRWY